jgi:hypothetical protein
MTGRQALAALPGGCAGQAAQHERAKHARQVEREFPGRHVWISSLDRWWAVRQGPDAHHGRDDLRPMTLDADDAAGLRALLARQAAPEQQP